MRCLCITLYHRELWCSASMGRVTLHGLWRSPPLEEYLIISLFIVLLTSLLHLMTAQLIPTDHQRQQQHRFKRVPQWLSYDTTTTPSPPLPHHSLPLILPFLSLILTSQTVWEERRRKSCLCLYREERVYWKWPHSGVYRPIRLFPSQLLLRPLALWTGMLY